MTVVQDPLKELIIPGYSIEELIFDKNSTRVYRARRLADNQTVMLKALRTEQQVQEQSASLKHEYEITNQFNGSNVIAVYGLERSHNGPVVVLEDFGGFSLSIIAQQRRLPLQEVLAIAVEIAKGLGEIHGANIIHKDINPSNVVYNPDTGQVKVIDFGISSYLTREQAAIANPQVVEASLPYVSPEQTGRMNRSVDYRSDYYAFGVTLFELLTGKLPFEAKEPIEWFHCHIAKQPPTPAEVDPSIPLVVSDLVMKLMAKMAEQRYQSAAGIQSDLQHCLDQLAKTGTIEPFELGQGDISQRFQVSQALYGREKEVEQLMRSFDRVSAGANELILVSGYSGVGKTCLIREIYKPITARRGYFIAGKFDQLQRNVPYSALINALRDLLRQLLTESETNLNQWRKDIQAAVGPNGQVIVDILRELEFIIGPQRELPDLLPVEADRRFHLTFLAFIRVFAQREHPLVLFLDDLQWADNASLNLLELLNNPESALPYLLVIGSYRDNEVQSGHPLLLSLKASTERGCPIEEIQLEPLGLEHLCELLADTFAANRDQVAALAMLVQKKTGGNPFFTEEFLQALYQKQLIQFDQERRCWQVDVEQVKAQQITDNVVELMTEKLRLLDSGALELVKSAACIGNRFPLKLLALASGAEYSLLQAQVQAAMRLGVIAPIGDAYQLLDLTDNPHRELTIEFSFAHDRIQQASYGLLDEAHKQRAHLKIGRLLLQDVVDVEAHDQLFDITNHLNLAIELIDEESERARLCLLNLAAGKRAKNATAHQASRIYFDAAIALLPVEPWQQRYDLALELYCEAAEAAFLCGDFENMTLWLAEGYAGATSLLDKVRYNLVELSALIAQGKLFEAIQLAKPVMAKLGHRYPANPNKFNVLVELFKSIWKFRNVDVHLVGELPEMTDARNLAANMIGARIGAAALFVQPDFLSMMVFRSLRVQYQYGHCPLAINSWVIFGMVLASQFGKPDKGMEYGRMALALSARFRSSGMEPRVLHLYNAMLGHWKEPLRNTIDPLQQAYRMAMDNGDFEYAVLAQVIRLMNLLDAGTELPTWKAELLEYHSTIKQLRQGHTIDMLDAFLQFCDNLEGRVEQPAVLTGECYDLHSKMVLHDGLGDKALIVLDRALSMWTRYLFGDIKGALEDVNAISVAATTVSGFYMVSRMYLLDALIRLASVPGSSRKQRAHLLKQVKKIQSKIKNWSKHNPDNFRNKYCLIEAERLRVAGHEFKAHSYFDQAINAAAEQGFLWELALANELCGSMHMAAGRTTIGLPYLMRALETYTRWGAPAKSDALLQTYPQLIRSLEKQGSDQVGGTTRTEQLANIDISALMKSLKAIAEEKGHGRMVELILSSALEFAAAQQAVLILRNTENLFLIEGEASISEGQNRVLQSLPVTQDRLPLTLFHYVVRTKTSIVIHDAQLDVEELPGLSKDPYIQQHSVRSVLCLPIVTGRDEDSELIGLLYLENNLVVGAFTQERFNTLEIIGMSAAGRLELSRKASFDGLTGLYNHEYFQNMLRQEFAASRRYKTDLGLILIDIDHFKQFNDTWGHQVGDLVLKEVAKLIKESCRDCDVVARYGGEEMVVILPSTNMPYVEEVAERVRTTIETRNIPHQDEILNVTISVGLSMLNDSIKDKDELIRRADEALYRSKANGRNQVTVAQS